MIEYQFKDIMVGFYDGPHATPSLSDEGPIFLGIKNIFETGGIDFKNIRHISETEFPKWTKRVVPKKDDIVFSYEATLHRYALIPDGFRGCLGRRMALIRVNKVIVNEQFLYQYFLSSKWRAFIETVKISGATVERISISKFPNYKIKLPSLPVQNKIASILTAYDELIENNKQRIKLLEEMAEEIYKEWFVRLRFPGYENTKNLDGLPLGWERKPIDEFLSFSMSKAKLKKFNSTKTYIATADVTDINITGQGEIIDWENKPSRAQLVPELNSVFFARMSNTYKVLVFSKTNKELIDELALTSGFLGLKALNEETLPYLFWLIKSDSFHNYKDVFANGATQVSLTNEGFHNIKLVEPSLSVIEKFGKSTSAFLSEIITLNKKNQVLQETRDLLLPRLISGKLSIEHLVEEELAMVAEPRAEYK